MKIVTRNAKMTIGKESVGMVYDLTLEAIQYNKPKFVSGLMSGIVDRDNEGQNIIRKHIKNELGVLSCSIHLDKIRSCVSEPGGRVYFRNYVEIYSPNDCVKFNVNFTYSGPVNLVIDKAAKLAQRINNEDVKLTQQIDDAFAPLYGKIKEGRAEKTKEGYET